MFRLDRDGTLEQFSGIKGLTNKQGKLSFFRKTHVSSVEEAVKKINDHIGKQPAYPRTESEKKVYKMAPEVVRPYRDKNKMRALQYIKMLKNPHKKDYAYSYFQFLMDGATGNPPENTNISVMGKQAVRMRLEEILSKPLTKSFLQDAMIKQEEDYDGVFQNGMND